MLARFIRKILVSRMQLSKKTNIETSCCPTSSQANVRHGARTSLLCCGGNRNENGQNLQNWRWVVDLIIINALINALID